MHEADSQLGLAAIEAESIGWIPLDHQLAGDNVIRGV